MPARFSHLFWLIGCAFFMLAAARPRSNSKSSPTAQLPIEPFSSDTEVLDSSHSGAANTEGQSASQAQALPSSTREASPTEGNGLGFAIRVQMAREGFGGQLRLTEYTKPWFGFSQTLRYFDNEAPDRLFERRYGIYMGMVLQPWKLARVSPFATWEGGWERFERDAEVKQDLASGELALGLKLQMNRLTSFALQWTEAFYPSLKTPLYPNQSTKSPRQASVEVFLNMNWETVL